MGATSLANVTVSVLKVMLDSERQALTAIRPNKRTRPLRNLASMVTIAPYRVEAIPWGNSIVRRILCQNSREPGVVAWFSRPWQKRFRQGGEPDALKFLTFS